MEQLPIEKNLSKFMQLVIETGRIKNEKQASALILGRAGSGKSQHFLKPLESLDFVFYTIDITPSLLRDFFNQVDDRKKKILVIEDFTALTGLGSKTREALLHLLKSGTDEGFKRIDHMGYQWESRSKERIQFGLVTSVTTGTYREFAISWKKTGFLRRLLPFSFKLSNSTKEVIQKEIMGGINRDSITINEKHFPLVSKRPETSDNVLEPFIRISQLLADSVDAEPMGHQKLFNSLVFANAALRGSKKVTQLDVNEILDLSRWINYKFDDI